MPASSVVHGPGSGRLGGNGREGGAHVAAGGREGAVGGRAAGAPAAAGAVAAPAIGSLKARGLNQGLAGEVHMGGIALLAKNGSVHQPAVVAAVEVGEVQGANIGVQEVRPSTEFAALLSQLATELSGDEDEDGNVVGWSQQ